MSWPREAFRLFDTQDPHGRYRRRAVHREVEARLTFARCEQWWLLTLRGVEPHERVSDRRLQQRGR